MKLHRNDLKLKFACRFGIQSGVINGPTFCGENLFQDVTVKVDWPDEDAPVTRRPMVGVKCSILD